MKTKSGTHNRILLLPLNPTKGLLKKWCLDKKSSRKCLGMYCMSFLLANLSSSIPFPHLTLGYSLSHTPFSSALILNEESQVLT
ncbi:UNVERIFIED_CONTAM: hypothetical protein FKN15_003367 [Acipenser sinensis]